MQSFPPVLTLNRKTYLSLSRQGLLHRINYRIVELFDPVSRNTTWYRTHRKMYYPFALITKDGTFCIAHTSSSLERRLICNVSPFYCYRYGRKARLVFDSWLIRITSSTQERAWKIHPGWNYCLKHNNVSKTEFICSEDHIEIQCNMQGDVLPLHGCYIRGQRQKGTKTKEVKNPRCKITWEEILQDIPLLHNIAVLLNDTELLKATSVNKWRQHLGWIYMSQKDLANCMYEQLKVNHPEITKVSIRKAVGSIPVRNTAYAYAWSVRTSLEKERRDKFMQSYLLKEDALFKAYPSLAMKEER
jgi:hypothetical protein